MYYQACLTLCIIPLLFYPVHAGNLFSGPERPPSPDVDPWLDVDLDQLPKAPVEPINAPRKAPKETFDKLIPDLKEMMEEVLHMPQFEDRNSPLDLRKARRQYGKPATTKPLRRVDPIAVYPSRHRKAPPTLELDTRDWPKASLEPMLLDATSKTTQGWTMRHHHRYPVVYFDSRSGLAGESDDPVADLRALYVNRLSTASKVALYHDVRVLDAQLSSLMEPRGPNLKIAKSAQHLLADMMWVIDSSARVDLRSDIGIPLFMWRKEDFRAFALAMSDHHIALNKPDDLLLDFLMRYGRIPTFQQRQVSPRNAKGDFILPPRLHHHNFDFTPPSTAYSSHHEHLAALKAAWPKRVYEAKYTLVHERREALERSGAGKEEEDDDEISEERQRESNEEENIGHVHQEETKNNQEDEAKGGEEEEETERDMPEDEREAKIKRRYSL